MTLLLKQIYNFIRLLHSDTDTRPLAWGFTFGLFLGFSPALSLQTFLIFFLLFLFRVQIGAAFLSAFVFKFVAFLFDPITDILGRWVLENQSLRPLWIELYNMPIIPMTRFNNSIVMGSFVFCVAISPLAYFSFKFLIEKYRDSILKRLEQTAFWKAFKATKFYLWYSKYQDVKAHF